MSLLKIKLMPDYRCDPIWWQDNSDGEVGPVDMDELSLSKSTVERLNRWAEVFDNFLDWDDPGNSPLVNEAESRAFMREGWCLWLQLREELAGKYEVWYYDIGRSKLYQNPAEVEPDFARVVCE